MHTPNEIKAIQIKAIKNEYAAARRAYHYSRTKENAARLAAAREAHAEITRQANAAATRVYNALYNPLRK